MMHDKEAVQCLYNDGFNHAGAELDAWFYKPELISGSFEKKLKIK